ncbi:MAG: prenyltransferase, partial [Acidobacteriaceae bacterium]
MSINKAILGPMRVPFLILTPACVMLGIATAARAGAHLGALQIILVFVGALCTHISVNAFNEYEDYKSGLDARTERTPFSGGSGTLQANPKLADIALATALISLVILALIGIYFTWLQGLA